MPAATKALSLLVCVSCSSAPPPETDGNRARRGASTAPTSATEARSTPASTHSADPEPTPREGALLAYADARFYSWSDRQRPRWSGEPTDRDKPPQRIVPLRVVASRGNYYEVILGAPPPGTCFGDLPSTWGVTMQLWMHRRDVIPSITAPLTRTYADGTSIQIAPGVAVTENDRGMLSLRSMYVTVMLRATDAIIGDVFAPPAKRPEPERAGRFLAGRGVHLELGPPAERSVAIVANPTADRSGRDTEIAELLDVAQRVARVRFEDPCITLVARVPEEKLVKQGSAWGMSGCGRGGLPAYVVEPGTEIFFPDGERAGTVTDRIRVAVRNADWGERACFMLAVDPMCPRDDTEGIELCVRRDALVPAK